MFAIKRYRPNTYGEAGFTLFIRVSDALFMFRPPAASSRHGRGRWNSNGSHTFASKAGARCARSRTQSRRAAGHSRATSTSLSPRTHRYDIPRASHFPRLLRTASTVRFGKTPNVDELVLTEHLRWSRGCTVHALR